MKKNGTLLFCSCIKHDIERLGVPTCSRVLDGKVWAYNGIIPPAERGDRNSSAVALQQGYDPPPTVPARLPWAATRVA